jgi:hypothetical protein
MGWEEVCLPFAYRSFVLPLEKDRKRMELVQRRVKLGEE